MKYSYSCQDMVPSCKNQVKAETQLMCFIKLNSDQLWNRAFACLMYSGHIALDFLENVHREETYGNFSENISIIDMKWFTIPSNLLSLANAYWRGSQKDCSMCSCKKEKHNRKIMMMEVLKIYSWDVKCHIKANSPLQGWYGFQWPSKRSQSFISSKVTW